MAKENLMKEYKEEKRLTPFIHGEIIQPLRSLSIDIVVVIYRRDAYI